MKFVIVDDDRSDAARTDIELQPFRDPVSGQKV